MSLKIAGIVIASAVLLGAIAGALYAYPAWRLGIAFVGVVGLAVFLIATKERAVKP